VGEHSEFLTSLVIRPLHPLVIEIRIDRRCFVIIAHTDAAELRFARKGARARWGCDFTISFLPPLSLLPRPIAAFHCFEEMDPLSIATSAFALIGVCTTILAFVESRLDVDNRVKNACAEVKGLVKVLQSLDTLARDPGLKGIGHSSHPADDVGNWEMVKQTMNECKGTLDKLANVLQDVSSVLMPGIPIPQFPIRTVKFQLKTGEITQYKEQIGGYLRLIQISLQLITVCVNLL
jgi:hypothetical protein